MVRHVAQGLSVLHSCQPPLIHGDLKAANVLVDSQFRAKIADFGLTTGRKGFLSGSKESSAPRGTPFWMAPELLNGSPCSVHSDMYAFGITLWEVFARLDPYAGEDVGDVLACVRDMARTPPKRPVGWGLGCGVEGLGVRV
jgi:serine/threonine protein kinase